MRGAGGLWYYVIRGLSGMCWRKELPACWMAATGVHRLSVLQSHNMWHRIAVYAEVKATVDASPRAQRMTQVERECLKNVSGGPRPSLLLLLLLAANMASTPD